MIFVIIVVVALFIISLPIWRVWVIVFGDKQPVCPKPEWFPEWLAEHRESVRYKTREEAALLRKERRERIAKRRMEDMAYFIHRGDNI